MGAAEFHDRASACRAACRTVITDVRRTLALNAVRQPCRVGLVTVICQGPPLRPAPRSGRIRWLAGEARRGRPARINGLGWKGPPHCQLVSPLALSAAIVCVRGLHGISGNLDGNPHGPSSRWQRAGKSAPGATVATTVRTAGLSPHGMSLSVLTGEVYRSGVRYEHDSSRTGPTTGGPAAAAPGGPLLGAGAAAPPAAAVSGSGSGSAHGAGGRGYGLAPAAGRLLARLLRATGGCWSGSGSGGSRRVRPAADGSRCRAAARIWDAASARSASGRHRRAAVSSAGRRAWRCGSNTHSARYGRLPELNASPHLASRVGPLA